MYLVVNYETGAVLSRHRTAIAAFQAAGRVQKWTQKWNGPKSYVPVGFRKIDPVNGGLTPVDICDEIGE